METHIIRPNFRRAYIIIGALALLGALAGAAVYALFDPAAGIGLGTISLLGFALFFLYATYFRYSHLYALNSEELTVTLGAISKVSRSVPVANIDNVTVEHTLTDKLLGVGSICIDTPGGTGYELVMRHIEAAELAEVVAELKANMKAQREIYSPRTPNRGGA